MLYKFELKQNIKKILLIIIISFLLILISFNKVNQEPTIDIIDTLPNILKGLLGFNSQDKTTILGSFFFAHTYILLILMLYLGSLGLKITSVSLKNKSDFLYTTISKKEILIKKSLANLTIMFILLLITSLCYLIVVIINNETDYIFILTVYIKTLFSLFLINSASMFIGSLKTNQRIASICCTAFIFLMYLIYSFSLAFNIKIVSYFSLFSYTIDGKFNIIYPIVSMIIGCLLTVLSIKNFENKDL